MNSLPMAEPEVRELPKLDVEEELDSGWKVIVWDDDIHTVEYVIEVFMKHFGLSEDVAVQRTLEVHTNGSSVLDRGSRSNMEFHSMVMVNQYGLTATIERDSDMG